MEIREVTPAEIKELIRAQYKSEAGYDPAIHVSEEGLETIIKWMSKKLDSGDALLLAAYEESPVGYVFAYVEHKNKKIWRYDFGKIADIYVVPESRRQGIGKKLMEAAEEWFKQRGVSEIILEVSCKNEAAIEFYKKLGFGTSNLIMRLSLQ